MDKDKDKKQEGNNPPPPAAPSGGTSSDVVTKVDDKDDMLKKLQTQISVLEDEGKKKDGLISDLTKTVEAARSLPSPTKPGKSLLDEALETFLPVKL